MYRVTKHGSNFRIYKDGEPVIVVATRMGTVYTLFSKLYDKGLTPCDNAFDWWLDNQRPQGLVCMLEQCTVRALRPDEHAEARVADITQAMQLCTAARLPIPQDWLDEYNELCTQLKGS